MSTAQSTLPIQETARPTATAEVAELIRDARESGTAVYPIGGGTSLDYGLPATRPGLGLELSGLDRVIDFPARDLTVTVEAGITLAKLSEVLAKERLRLPIDAPQAERATLGGLIATNWSGPRRYGCGTIRDYVIGISAVDGRGVAFQGGGRVVKNVAGYDFCKLLTGSLGTLAVITQVTLKLRPQAERKAMMGTVVGDLGRAESLLAALGQSQTTPTAIELLGGPRWRSEASLKRVWASGPTGDDASGMLLLVALEGTAAEVIWMQERLASEWREQGVINSVTLSDEEAAAAWSPLTSFSAEPGAAMVLKASLRPSAVTTFIAALREVDASCSIQAHAGSGVVKVRLGSLPKEGLARTLVGRLQAAARAGGGNVVIVSLAGGGELTHQSAFGSGDWPVWLMGEVKKQFDPGNILNPGRFVYHGC